MNIKITFLYRIIWLLIFLGLYHFSKAQSLADGILIPQKTLCVGVSYQYESWKDYWEGTLKRENLNLGRVSTQSVMSMATYGITSKINIVVGLPYIWTKASAGTLAGQSNLQDLIGGIKYEFFDTKFGDHRVGLSAVIGGSMPLTNYTPDLLPLSIGLQSKTVFGRLLVDYRHPRNIFFTASASYIDRAIVKLDRESYYTTHQIYSNEVAMPDVLQLMARSGYYTSKWSLEAMMVYQNCLDGFDIRRNDMPFVSNEMDMTRIGVGGLYTIPSLQNLQLTGMVQYTLTGRNVGQATIFSFGLMKLFNFSKQKNEN